MMLFYFICSSLIIILYYSTLYFEASSFDFLIKLVNIYLFSVCHGNILGGHIYGNVGRYLCRIRGGNSRMLRLTLEL